MPFNPTDVLLLLAMGFFAVDYLLKEYGNV